MHAAVRRVAREGQHGGGEFELGFRHRCRVGGFEVGRRIFGRLEAVGIDAAQIGDGFGRARGRRAVIDPERRVIAVAIERFDAGPLALAAEHAVAAGGENFAQLLAEDRIERMRGADATGAGAGVAGAVDVVVGAAAGAAARGVSNIVPCAAGVTLGALFAISAAVGGGTLAGSGTGTPVRAGAGLLDLGVRLARQRQNQRKRRSGKNPVELHPPHRCLLIRPRAAL